MIPAFLDAETTGLYEWAGHEMWELAIIAPEPGRQGPYREWEFRVRVDLAKADPMALRISGYYDRRIDTIPPCWQADGGGWEAMHPDSVDQDDEEAMAAMIAELLRDRVIVGNVPAFDTGYLVPYVRARGQAVMWHYQVVDVEALAVGYLAGLAGPGASALTVSVAEGFRSAPWDSNALSTAVGVNPGDYDRHTALGDAQWARAVYEAVLGPVGP